MNKAFACGRNVAGLERYEIHLGIPDAAKFFPTLPDAHLNITRDFKAINTGHDGNVVCFPAESQVHIDVAGLTDSAPTGQAACWSAATARSNGASFTDLSLGRDIRGPCANLSALGVRIGVDCTIATCDGHYGKPDITSDAFLPSGSHPNYAPSKLLKLPERETVT